MKREVALKVISPQLLKDEAAERRFNREVEAAARLSHPNIVTAHDAGEDHGVHYLVMEYVAGSDLTERVRNGGPLRLAEAVECTLQAARGLAYAHDAGIVHRDIKPSNLLLDASGTVKVLDMGLARLDPKGDETAMRELTSTGMVMGTVDYMAPEQALDAKTADARSDIYSLGCTMYFLVTGRPVYDGDTVMKRILGHREQPIPKLTKEVGNAASGESVQQLERAFRRMVAKDPRDRFSTMHEVVEALEPIRQLFNQTDPLMLEDESGMQRASIVATTDRSKSDTRPSALLDDTITLDDSASRDASTDDPETGTNEQSPPFSIKKWACGRRRRLSCVDSTVSADL